jgi:hypothetical protein
VQIKARISFAAAVSGFKSPHPAAAATVPGLRLRLAVDGLVVPFATLLSLTSICLDAVIRCRHICRETPS